MNKGIGNKGESAAGGMPALLNDVLAQMKEHAFRQVEHLEHMWQFADAESNRAQKRKVDVSYAFWEGSKVAYEIALDQARKLYAIVVELMEVL